MREWVRRGALALALASIGGGIAYAQVFPEPERVTFDEAIRRALEKNPGIAEAAQAILQAETLLQQARIVYRPTVGATMTTTVLDAPRGFEEFVTQPRTQSQIA